MVGYSKPHTTTSLLLDVAAVNRDDGFHTETGRLVSLDDAGSACRLSGLHDVRLMRLQIWMGWSLNLILQYAPDVVVEQIVIGRLERPHLRGSEALHEVEKESASLQMPQSHFLGETWRTHGRSFLYSWWGGWPTNFYWISRNFRSTVPTCINYLRASYTPMLSLHTYLLMLSRGERGQK